uniref:PDZ domain containing 11 n=1 Tax=Canis lupus familiaris TaxID=9615 RepID=A0A8C0TLA7_CANLF
MDSRIPYDDYPVVFLPAYENPPAWIPPHERVYHPDYNNELTQFLPRIVTLKKPPGAQLGFNIRGGKASQLGIFISKVIPDSDAHRAGLQEGDQVLAVNDVDFQDIEHSKYMVLDRKPIPMNTCNQESDTLHHSSTPNTRQSQNQKWRMALEKVVQGSTSQRSQKITLRRIPRKEYPLEKGQSLQ